MSESTISTAADPPMASSSSWTANAANSPPTKTRWTTERTAGHRYNSASTRTSSVGGIRIIAIAKITMSPPVLPRATKNSGESASTSNSGLANAKAQSTAR